MFQIKFKLQISLRDSTYTYLPMNMEQIVFQNVGV